ncbi:hypothetical protein [Haloferula sargassicola]|uniref:Uncharacterized protein n=1 Tax=Haloferula sargassicola TaxID=490096 RepID=A0ABP9UWE5_9BACT
MGKDEAPAKETKRKGGCLGRLVVLFVLLGLGGLAYAAFLVLQPQDTSDIAGTGPGARMEKARDLKEVLRNASERSYELALTEDEINRYLAQTLKAKQSGPLAEQVSVPQVAVRLEKDRAEVVITRDVAGHPFTTSMYLRVEQLEMPDGQVTTRILRNGGPYHPDLPAPLIGGRFGKVPVPEGFLHLVLPAFEKLAAVYRTPSDPSGGPRSIPVKELDFVEDMARIRIEEGKLVLDPTGDQGMVPRAGP